MDGKTLQIPLGNKKSDNLDFSLSPVTQHKEAEYLELDEPIKRNTVCSLISVSDDKQEEINKLFQMHVNQVPVDSNLSSNQLKAQQAILDPNAHIVPLALEQRISNNVLATTTTPSDLIQPVDFSTSQPLLENANKANNYELDKTTMENSIVSQQAIVNQPVEKVADITPAVGQPIENLTSITPPIGQSIPEQPKDAQAPSLDAIAQQKIYEQSLLYRNSKKNKKGVLTKTIGCINPYYKYFPKFYRKELKRSFIQLGLWLIIFLTCLTLSIVFCIWVNYQGSQFGKTMVPLLSVFLTIGALAMFIYHAMKHHLFREEGMYVDFAHGKVVTINVVKIYKSCRVGHIKANWLCSLGYSFVFIATMLLLICSWVINGYTQHAFIYPMIAGFNDFFITFLIFMFVLIISFLLHIYIVIGNYWRAAKIDNYYGQYIVSNEEIQALKKKVNRRYMIIYLVSVALLFFVGFLIYKLVKKAVSKNPTVQTIQVK